MANYIDGFVLPIPRDCLSDYKQLAEAIALIWKEHGALSYKEYLGDDLALDGTRSFADVTAATEDEVVIFGWVEFESREARELANRKVASDERVAELMKASNSGFDAERMIYGGFESSIR